MARNWFGENPDHKKAGSLGGKETLRKYGSEHFRLIGKRGGSKPKKKIKE